MRKLINGVGILCSLMLLCSMFTGLSFSADAATSGDYEYSLCEDNTAEITKYTGNDTVVSIPSKLDDYKVTKIGNSAFSYCKEITSVSVPDSVTVIADSAFMECVKLEDIKLSNNITRIDNYAFWGCESLKSITLPDRLGTVNNCSFAYCTELNNIIATENSDNYVSVDGVLYSKDKTKLVCYPVGRKDQSFSVPEGVTQIYTYAFSFTKNLTELNLGNSVTTIDMLAFSDMENVASLFIPENVANIDSSAFNGCNKLKEITVSEKNNSFSSDNGILFNKDKTKIVRFPSAKSDTTFTIPSSVTSIGHWAFWGCTNFKTISIPNTVTRIGNGAFEYCENLEQITIPDSITEVPSYMLESCSKLKRIVIPDSVEKINSWVFTGCDMLTDILIGKGVTYIDNYAFRYCSGLVNVYYPGTQEDWSKIYVGTNNDELINAVKHYNTDKLPPIIVPAKTTVSLAKSSASIYVKGSTTIKFTVKNGNGKTSFTSSNKNVAKVSSTGKVTGLKKGTATITVKNNGVSKTFKVTVNNPKLNKKSTSIKKGKTFTLKITGKVGKAKYVSSNKKVATVNKKGKITGKKKGKATITVTTNGMKLKCKVTVK